MPLRVEILLPIDGGAGGAFVAVLAEFVIPESHGGLIGIRRQIVLAATEKEAGEGTGEKQDGFHRKGIGELHRGVEGGVIFRRPGEATADF
jgi:hypothetical protein